jgi:hypothetical protein
MKPKLQATKIFFFILSLFILGCILVSPAATPSQATIVGGTSMPPSAELATLPPSVAPTATIYPPVFNPDALGDNRELASFILTRNDKTTGGGGEVEEHKVTIGYIKEPFSAYNLSESSSSLYGETYIGDSHFLIGGRLYTKDGQSGPPWYYYVHLEPDPTDIDYYFQSAVNMSEGYIKGGDLGPLSAQFVGQEDFEGIPANHFTLDQTNLRESSDPSGTYKIENAQGDFYLAQEGNYPLFFHIKVTGNVYPVQGSLEYSPGEREITEELTSINQLTEITLPADFPAFELDLGLPLPAGTTLHSVQTDEAKDYDYYDYFMPETVSHEEFLEFYRNMASTNGWTVSSIGKITDNYSCQSQDCVILKKGNAQVILSRPELCVSTMPADYVCIGAEYYK